MLFIMSDICTLLYATVAEWSKAPDGFERTKPLHCSGPRMWAWVQIPPVANFYFPILPYSFPNAARK